MIRPYIICHMLQSIDGKVTGDFLSLNECEEGVNVYYQINRDLKGDAFACGRVTMESSFTNYYYPDLSSYKGKKVERKDYIAKYDKKFFAIAFDRKGRLGWKESTIVDEDPGYGEAHIIEVLSEQVKDEYLSYLQDIGVSYIFAGKEDIDILLAVQKLYQLFGIKRLLLEGGSVINGAFLKEGIIDEISLVVVPLTGSTLDKPLFYEGNIAKYELIDSKIVGQNIILNYKLR